MLFLIYSHTHELNNLNVKKKDILKILHQLQITSFNNL